MTHKEVIDEMKQFFEVKPEVGIFWYDFKKNQLFQVYSLPMEDLSENFITYPKLHKTIWQKLHFKALMSKQQGVDYDEIFFSDYTQIPRGRIFYKNNIFYVFTGEWIKQNEALIKQQIIEEFNLSEAAVIFKLDTHWDIGHSWSSEQDELNFDK